MRQKNLSGTPLCQNWTPRFFLGPGRCRPSLKEKPVCACVCVRACVSMCGCVPMCVRAFVRAFACVHSHACLCLCAACMHRPGGCVGSAVPKRCGAISRAWHGDQHAYCRCKWRRRLSPLALQPCAGWQDRMGTLKGLMARRRAGRRPHLSREASRGSPPLARSPPCTLWCRRTAACRRCLHLAQLGTAVAAPACARRRGRGGAAEEGGGRRKDG